MLVVSFCRASVLMRKVKLPHDCKHLSTCKWWLFCYICTLCKILSHYLEGGFVSYLLKHLSQLCSLPVLKQPMIQFQCLSSSKPHKIPIILYNVNVCFINYHCKLHAIFHYKFHETKLLPEIKKIFTNTWYIHQSLNFSYMKTINYGWSIFFHILFIHNKKLAFQKILIYKSLYTFLSHNQSSTLD